MHDLLEHALRRWHRIRPDPGTTITDAKRQELAIWLEREVCPVVRQLTEERPDFRQLARWSLDNLLPSCKGEPRRLVEAIDREIVARAKSMAAKLEDIQKHRSAEQARTRKEELGGESPKIPDMLAAMNYIGTRPWIDLVSPQDYFGSLAQLNLRDRKEWLGPDSRRVQIAEFLPWVRPELAVPCDFLMTCFEIRVDYWRSILQRTAVSTQAAWLPNESAPGTDVSASQEAIPELENNARQLRQLVYHAPDSILRTACVVLVQIYAVFFPGANLTWLGDAAKTAGKSPWLLRAIKADSGSSIPEIAAASLTHLATLYRSKLDVESSIQEAARDHRLCIVAGRGRREVYWEGELLPIDWIKHGRAWKLLAAMAESAAVSGQGIDSMSDCDFSFAGARRDLLHLLPPGLAKHVTIKKGAHRLTLFDRECGFLTFNVVDRIEKVVRGQTLVLG